MLTNFLFSFFPLPSYPHFLCFLIINEFLLLYLWLRKCLKNISINSIHWGFAKYFSFILRLEEVENTCMMTDVHLSKSEWSVVKFHEFMNSDRLQSNRNIATWDFFTIFCVSCVLLVIDNMMPRSFISMQSVCLHLRAMFSTYK